MKTKKMLFKAAVCLMAVAFVFSSVSALAADYYTTTIYKLGTNEVTVKTTVTDVTTGEIAYIAYTGEDPEAEGAIFHIDQKTSSSDNTFTYTTTADKISGTHAMLVGTQEAGKLSTEVTDKAKFGTDFDLAITIENGSITLTDATSTEEVPNVATFDANGTLAVANGNILTYALEAAEGYDAATAVVTYNGEVITETTLPAITADATLAVTFSEAKKATEAVKEEEVVAAETVTEDTMKAEDDTDVTVDSLTKFGKIALGDAAVAKYGIIISDGTEEIEVLGGGIELLPQTEGAFAIVIQAEDGEFVGTYNVKTFVEDAEGNKTFGAEYTYVDGVASLN